MQKDIFPEKILPGAPRRRRCVLPAPEGCWTNSEAGRRRPVRKISCETGISDDHTINGWIAYIMKYDINNYIKNLSPARGRMRRRLLVRQDNAGP